MLLPNLIHATENPSTTLSPGLNAAVLLRVKKQNTHFICSGALIQNNIVVTAAHCLDGASEVQVTNDPILQKAGNHFVMTTEWKMHPGYTGNNLTGIDLAVIKLKSPIEIKIYFTPTPMPAKKQLGKIDFQRIGFGIRDGINKRNLFSENSIKYSIGSHYIQAYDENGLVGDSGGPVFLTYDQQANSLALIGVHSGRKQDAKGALENYSNTLALNDELVGWIQKMVSVLNAR